MRSPEGLDVNDGYSAIKRKIDSDYAANQAIWQIYWTEATLNKPGVDKSSLIVLETLRGDKGEGESHAERLSGKNPQGYATV